MRFLILLLLAGCVTDAEFARQNATWTPNYQPIYLYVEDAQSACIAIGARHAQGTNINGCADAFGRVYPRLCTIILPHNPPAWLKEHEELHCKYGAFHR